MFRVARGMFMLRKIPDQIKDCLDRAADARRQAEESADQARKAEYLRSEFGWIRLARSHEFAESLERFLLKPDAANEAGWHHRIVEAHNSLTLEDARDECSDRRTASLVRRGPYEVRLVELSRNLQERPENLWLELFDHHHNCTIDSYRGSRLEDMTAAAESLCSKAKYLSLECTNSLPVIAVIDDDPDILEALELILSSSGYRPALFASAEEFFKAAATSDAACLVVDIQLGGISGVELGRQLSASGFTFPIIFVTGSRDELHRRQAMDCGCVAFLLKPFSADRLIEAVTRAIDSEQY
jgi:CheY-like chemotaxis protein